MLVICPNCSKQLNLPADKIPNKPFAVNCPACATRIPVDPKGAASPAPPSAASETNTTSTETIANELRPLPAAEQQLLATMAPTALIVDFDDQAAALAAKTLTLLGFADQRRIATLDDLGELLQETEIGVLLIAFDKVAPPPCESLAALYKLPLDLRRRTFTALIADNLRSLDGQAAFFFQVNCVLCSQDNDALAAKLRRALLFHAKHYRFWSSQD